MPTTAELELSGRSHITTLSLMEVVAPGKFNRAQMNLESTDKLSIYFDQLDPYVTVETPDGKTLIPWGNIRFARLAT